MYCRHFTLVSYWAQSSLAYLVSKLKLSLILDRNLDGSSARLLAQFLSTFLKLETLEVQINNPPAQTVSATVAEFLKVIYEYNKRTLNCIGFPPILRFHLIGFGSPAVFQTIRESEEWRVLSRNAIRRHQAQVELVFQ